MIVIKENGNEKTFVARCYNCASDLEYKRTDVKSERTDIHRPESYFITCPVCGASVVASLRTQEDIELNKTLNPYLGCCAI